MDRVAANVGDIKQQIWFQCILCVQGPLLIVRTMISGPVDLRVWHIGWKSVRPDTEETEVNSRRFPESVQRTIRHRGRPTLSRVICRRANVGADVVKRGE